MSVTPSPNNRDGGGRRGQGGFTLVEVMVASVILSVFVLGLSGLWQASNRRVEDLVVKQKAVFVLNAEMERLSALYAHTSFGKDGPDSASVFDNPVLPTPRLVYPDEVEDWMEDDDDDFVTTSFGSFLSGSEFQVYRTAGFNPRAYVWIDRGRNIAARLSWAEEDIVVPLLNCLDLDFCQCRDDDGGGSGYCGEVQLFIEYPFRPTADGVFATPANLRTMTLTTIMGRVW